MAFRFAAIALFSLVHCSLGAPAVTLEDLELADDTMSVGSYIREVRAAAPDNYHKSYENEGNGEVGYSRRKSGGGKKGYQHFDTYHKKAGDNYEFQKEDSFGLENKGEKGAHSHQHERREKLQEEKEENPDDEHESVESEGDQDGNGGVEAKGHDKADYVLPEKYEYGAGEEYNF